MAFMLSPWCHGAVIFLNIKLNIHKILLLLCFIRALFCHMIDQNKTVNIITELFTSGSLRQYVYSPSHDSLKIPLFWFYSEISPVISGPEL